MSTVGPEAGSVVNRRRRRTIFDYSVLIMMDVMGHAWELLIGYSALQCGGPKRLPLQISLLIMFESFAASGFII
jgi:hypothetical protein